MKLLNNPFNQDDNFITPERMSQIFPEEELSNLAKDVHFFFEEYLSTPNVNAHSTYLDAVIEHGEETAKLISSKINLDSGRGDLISKWVMYNTVTTALKNKNIPNSYSNFEVLQLLILQNVKEL